jgi:hypothetical protein
MLAINLFIILSLGENKAKNNQYLKYNKMEKEIGELREMQNAGKRGIKKI